MLLWRDKRRHGLNALVLSTLISLLFGQFFAFASNQFAALESLVLQLVILGALRFSIAADTHTQPDDPSGLVAGTEGVSSEERTRDERAEDAGV
ncbi:MAG: hypothetical protein QM589_12750 [Thermomicrobiales bacterium]